VSSQPVRSSSYGENRRPTPVDRLGVWLSARAIRRRVRLDGARIADFGCGYDARFVRSVVDRVRSATVVDVSLAADLGSNSKIEAIEGSIPDVVPALPAASFDTVLCVSVLEHLWEPEEALREFRRVLAPGGRLFVNVPSWRGKRFLELAAFRLGVSPAEEMDDHKHYYDPRELWTLLVAAGFKPSGIRCRRHKLGLNTYAVCATVTDPG
jgi:SAM-dependent methyltransferase